MPPGIIEPGTAFNFGSGSIVFSHWKSKCLLPWLPEASGQKNCFQGSVWNKLASLRRLRVSNEGCVHVWVYCPIPCTVVIFHSTWPQDQRGTPGSSEGSSHLSWPTHVKCIFSCLGREESWISKSYGVTSLIQTYCHKTYWWDSLWRSQKFALLTLSEHVSNLSVPTSCCNL